jgi:DNA-binding transcriptional LysR family regulator
MNYTINQLRIFLKIAQTQSVTKASEELYLTQPAVSIQLKNFQGHFDIPLTEMIGRKIFITDFGKEIAVAAERILNEVYAINYKTLAYKGQLIGNLKISVVSTGKYIIPYFLSGFLKQHDGIELQLDVTNKAQVIKSLENNEVDFSLVSVMPDNMKLNKLELMQNQLYLVGNNEKKFKEKIYEKKIFETLPLIYREQGSGTRHVMEKFILKNKLPVKKKMELTSNEAVKQAVIAGMGFSIMPLIGIKNELNNGELQIIPVKGFPIKSIWNLIWLKDKGFSMVANSFLNYLKTEKQNIIKEKFNWFEMYALK